MSKIPATYNGIPLGYYATKELANAAKKGAKFATQGLLDQYLHVLKPKTKRVEAKLASTLEVGITRTQKHFRVKLEGFDKRFSTYEAAKEAKKAHLEWLIMTPTERFESARLVINEED